MEQPTQQRLAMKRFSKWCGWDWVVRKKQVWKKMQGEQEKCWLVHLVVVPDREVETAGGTWELSCFTAIFPPVVFGTQVDCKHFESGTVFSSFSVLCIELLSTPLTQIIVQQKPAYNWQGWKSDPFVTLGKLEIMSYRNSTTKTMKWGGERDGGTAEVDDVVSNFFLWWTGNSWAEKKKMSNVFYSNDHIYNNSLTQGKYE